jgi:hypothetical protein
MSNLQSPCTYRTVFQMHVATNLVFIATVRSLYSLCCTVCAIQSVLYSLCCTVCAVQCVLYSLCCRVCAVQFVLYSLCCTVCALQFIRTNILLSHHAPFTILQLCSACWLLTATHTPSSLYRWLSIGAVNWTELYSISFCVPVRSGPSVICSFYFYARHTAPLILILCAVDTLFLFSTWINKN